MFNDIYGPSTSEHIDETFGMLVAAVQRTAHVETPEARNRAYRLWAYIHGLVSLELAGLVDSSTDAASQETTFLTALRSAASLIWEAPR